MSKKNQSLVHIHALLIGGTPREDGDISSFVPSTTPASSRSSASIASTASSSPSTASSSPQPPGKSSTSGSNSLGDVEGGASSSSRSRRRRDRQPKPKPQPEVNDSRRAASSPTTSSASSSTIPARKMRTPREWQHDFDMLQRELSGVSNGKIKIHGCHPASVTASKRETAQRIATFFEECADPAKMLLLYWSGHGREGTGDWIFAEGRTLSLAELLRLWKKSKACRMKRTLLIVSDCCYSGIWCSALKDLRSKYKDCSVAIQAACKSREAAYLNCEGSYLTRKLLHDMSMPNQLDNSTFIWACRNQHPCFALLGDQMERKKIHQSDTGEYFCVIGGVRLCRIECEWHINRSFTKATFWGDGIFTTKDLSHMVI